MIFCQLCKRASELRIFSFLVNLTYFADGSSTRKQTAPGMGCVGFFEDVVSL